MSTVVILPPPDALSAAAAELAERQPERQALIDRALHDLLSSKPAIVRISGAYLVPSSSRAGIVHRIGDLAGCSCEAGRKGRKAACRHTTTLELIEKANTYVLPPLALKPSRVAARRVSYEQAIAEMAELFG